MLIKNIISLLLISFAAPDFIHYPSHTREVGRQVAVALGT